MSVNCLDKDQNNKNPILKNQKNGKNIHENNGFWCRVCGSGQWRMPCRGGKSCAVRRHRHAKDPDAAERRAADFRAGFERNGAQESGRWPALLFNRHCRGSAAWHGPVHCRGHAPGRRWLCRHAVCSGRCQKHWQIHGRPQGGGQQKHRPGGHCRQGAPGHCRSTETARIAGLVCGGVKPRVSEGRGRGGRLHAARPHHRGIGR